MILSLFGLFEARRNKKENNISVQAMSQLIENELDESFNNIAVLGPSFNVSPPLLSYMYIWLDR